MTDNAAIGPLDELWGALAEGTAEPPPPSLGDRIVAAALLERGRGRPATPLPAIGPVEAFRRRVLAFDALLGSLRREEWHRPVLRDLDIQGLVGHLIGVESAFQRAVGMAPSLPSPQGVPVDDDPAVADHIASTQPSALAQATRDATTTRAEWRQTAELTLDGLRAREASDLDRVISFHGLTMPLGGLVVVRAFELWTHDEDVRRATERPLKAPDPSSLASMAELAVHLLPAGMARAGVDEVGGTARIVLTGPGGGCWVTPLGGRASPRADVRLVIDVVDFCRLVANRVSPSAVAPDVTGDEVLATGILRGAAALALD